jgi:hypothetical protein
MVRFRSVNGRYQKCDGRDFISVSLHSGSKFSKKKKPKDFKILEGRPKVLLYIFPKNKIQNSSPSITYNIQIKLQQN